ncbi:MAG: efflux RND transporter permease subunit, partial [Acidobacteriota bacterium]
MNSAANDPAGDAATQGRTAAPAPGALDVVLARPVSVSIAALGLVLLGLFSLQRLPVSLLPTLERPSLRIHAVDTERSRSELLTQLVLPLERRLLALDGVLDVGARVDDGDVVFTLDTEWQTEIDRLRIDVERRLTGEAVGGLEALSVEVDAGDAQPILEIAVTGGDAARRTAFAEKVLLPELARVPGAGRLVLTGGADRRPVVTPRPADLAAHGLVAADLAQRLESVGRDQPLGRLRSGGTVRPFFLRHEVTSVDALAALAVSEAGLRLDEVATVQLRVVPRAGVARVNGREAVLIEVHRAPGRNAVRLAREARGVAAELAARSAPFRLETVGDSSAEVVSSLGQLAQAGLIGLVLGTLVLRFLLGSWRPTLALVVVVPVSIVAAFSAFLAAGVSLDLVSLAGLALAAGMLVDNSIVVLESIQVARERRAADPIVDGTRQIAMALVASFATTAVVFLPLIYLRGLARAFFGVQAFAIVSTLLVSLALSLSLTPVLARRFGSHRVRGADRQPGRDAYLRGLGAVLRRPGVTVVVTLLALAAVAAAAPRLPRELVPRSAVAEATAEIRLPAGLGPSAATRRLGELDAAFAPHLEPHGAAWRMRMREKESSRAFAAYRGPAELEETARLEVQFPNPAALDAA